MYVFSQSGGDPPCFLLKSAGLFKKNLNTMSDKPKSADEEDYPNDCYNLRSAPYWQLTMRMVGATVLGIFIIWMICRANLTEPAIFWQTLIGAISSYLVLMAMFVQASIFWRQWQQTKAFFEMIERPALGIVRTLPERRSDGSVAIKTVIANSGKTYAKIVYQAFWWDGIQTSDGLLAGNIPLPGDDPTVSPITQSFIHMNGVREYVHCVLDADKWKEVTSGACILVLWMKLQYMGLTDKVHTFESYTAFNPANGAFIDCPTNNYAD